MNKDIIFKKLKAFENIYNSYVGYKGNTKSLLETEINNLSGKISEEDFNKLLNGFKCYRQFIFNMFAHTHRVYIKFSKKENDLNFLDMDKMFEDLEEI